MVKSEKLTDSEKPKGYVFTEAAPVTREEFTSAIREGHRSARSGLEDMHHLASELDGKESGQPSNVWRHFKHWCAANGESFESEEAFAKFGRCSRHEYPQRSAYRGPEGEEFLYWWKDLDRWVDSGYMTVRETEKPHLRKRMEESQLSLFLRTA